METTKQRVTDPMEKIERFRAEMIDGYVKKAETQPILSFPVENDNIRYKSMVKGPTITFHKETKTFAIEIATGEPITVSKNDAVEIADFILVCLAGWFSGEVKAKVWDHDIAQLEK